MFYHPEDTPPLQSHPEVFSSDLRGADLSELFLRLVSRQIDDLSIDGVKILAVAAAEHHDHQNATQVIATDETGRSHLFVYGSGQDDLVAHFLLPEV